MDAEFLLDTQALRSLPFAAIRKAVAAGLRLAVSPISCWELLTHLDETTGEGGFERRKAWLLKARGLRILDDPFAEHAVKIAAPGVAHGSRFEDGPVLRLVLDALDGSRTLDELYGKTIVYRGEVRAIKDSADRARRALADAERDYAAHVQRMIALIDDQIGRDKLRTVDDDRYVVVASAGTTKLVEFYKGFGYDAQPEHVFESLYPHLGYVFERARQYAINAGTNGSPMVDPNDTEDGMLCLHLGLADNRVLVTDDKGTRKALSEAGARLERQLEVHDGIKRRFRLAMTCAEFTAMVNAAPLAVDEDGK